MNADKKICKTCAKQIFDLEQQLSISQEEVLRLQGKVAALQDIIDEPLNK